MSQLAIKPAGRLPLTLTGSRGKHQDGSGVIEAASPGCSPLGAPLGAQQSKEKETCWVEILAVIHDSAHR